ncbi:MAG: sugar phosphate isomerase/epimerase family protein [Isosphaeraceae bacterium]
MRLHTGNRRQFIQQSGALAGACVVGARLPTHARGKEAGAIRLGGPTFSPASDPDEMAQAHRRLGYRAAYCPGVDLKDATRVRDIEKAFARHDVVIAEVGRWVNLLDADPARRAANLRTVSDGLALAEAVGARCCVDIAGSFHPTIWFGPDPRNLTSEFFDAVVENARKIIDAVHPRRARFCYEMMGWALPDSPDSYVKMIRAVDRPAFAVHLDPCNLINSPERFYHNTALLNECFDKLGPWIASCHAKDLTWDVEMNVHFREVEIGKGKLDYKTYLKRVAALPGDVPLMIEHMKDQAEFDRCRQNVMSTGKKLGLKFE